MWKDKDLSVANPKAITAKERQNVYKYAVHENKIVDANGKFIKDNREWSFTRLDEIENIPD